MRSKPPNTILARIQHKPNNINSKLNIYIHHKNPTQILQPKKCTPPLFPRQRQPNNIRPKSNIDTPLPHTKIQATIIPMPIQPHHPTNNSRVASEDKNPKRKKEKKRGENVNFFRPCSMRASRALSSASSSCNPPPAVNTAMDTWLGALNSGTGGHKRAGPASFFIFGFFLQ